MLTTRLLAGAALAVALAGHASAQPLAAQWGSDTRPLKPADAVMKAIDSMIHQLNFIHAERQGEFTAVGWDEKDTVIVTAVPDGNGSRIVVFAAGADAKTAERLRNTVRTHVFEGKLTPGTPAKYQTTDTRRKAADPGLHVGITTLNHTKAEFDRLGQASMAREGLTTKFEDNNTTLVGTGPDGIAVAFYDPQGDKKGRLTVFGVSNKGNTAEHLRNVIRGDLVNGIDGPASFGYGHMLASGRRPLLLIELKDPAKPAGKHDAAYYDKLLFGTTGNTVSGYYTANSSGRFGWTKAGILGPYSVDKLDKLTEDQVGQTAIRLAAEKGKFNFAAFDANKDGTVDGKELCIVVVNNLGTEAGAGRGVSPVKVGSPAVTVAVGNIVHMNPQAGFATWNHEICHHLGAVDAYGPWDPKLFKLNNNLTLMAGTITGTLDDPMIFHLDPWHKMQFGWESPRLFDATRPGSATLDAQQTGGPATMTAKRPLLLYDPARGPNEFFLIEFRSSTFKGGGYDKNVASTGVIVWHVKQKADKTLDLVTSDQDKKIQVLALFSRGAPKWEMGGGQAWTDANGPAALKWLDGTATGTKLKVGKVAPDGGSVTVHWDR